MNRSNLVLFLGALGGILAFSMLSGAAAAVWGPPPPKSASKGKLSKPTLEVDASEDEERDEDGEPKEYPNGKLRGRIVDARSQEPVAGARVGIWNFRAKRTTPMARGETTTDKSGRFELTIPPSTGKVRVGVRASDYFTVTREVGFEGESTMDLELGRNALVQGRILLPTGSPPLAKDEEITLSFTVRGFARIPKDHRTIRVGSTTFRTALAPGKWEVEAWGPRSLRAEMTTIVVGEDDMQLDLELKPQAAENR